MGHNDHGRYYGEERPPEAGNFDEYRRSLHLPASSRH